MKTGYFNHLIQTIATHFLIIIEMTFTLQINTEHVTLKTSSSKFTPGPDQDAAAANTLLFKRYLKKYYVKMLINIL